MCPYVLQGIGKDSAHSLQQEFRGNLSNAVKKHLQLLPILHKHCLILTLKQKKTKRLLNMHKIMTTE